MLSNLQILHQRNKLIVGTLWFTAAISIVLMASTFSLGELLNTMWSSLLINLIVTFLVWKKYGIRWTKYLVAFSCLASTFNAFKGPDVSLSMSFLVVFYLIVISLYEDWILNIAVFITTSTVTIYFYSRNYDFKVPEEVLTELITMDFFKILILIALITQGRFNKKTRNQAEALFKEVVAMKDQNEESMEAVTKSIRILKDFSRDLVNNITAAARISKEVTQAFGEMAAGAANQAASVGQISDSIQYTSHFVSGVKSASDQMSRLSSATFDVVKEGNRKLEDLNAEIEEMSYTTRSIAEVTQELNEQSVQIGLILSGIKEVAEQTNLLALNAAIEAARAGEHGRGFAIVAGEIRKLAENSKRSTESIGSILGGIRQKTESAAQRSAIGSQAVLKSEQALVSLKSAFLTIVENADQVNQESVKIDSMIGELSQSSENITEEAISISGITEQSSAATEEILASIEEQSLRIVEIENKYIELDQIIEQLESIASKK